MINKANFPHWNAPRVLECLQLSWASRTWRVPHHGPCEEPMTFRCTVPTLLLHPTTSCPRCDRRHILALAVDAESDPCGSLWPIPHGWTAHTKPAMRWSTERGLAWSPVHPIWTPTSSQLSRRFARSNWWRVAHHACAVNTAPPRWRRWKSLRAASPGASRTWPRRRRHVAGSASRSARIFRTPRQRSRGHVEQAAGWCLLVWRRHRVSRVRSRALVPRLWPMGCSESRGAAGPLGWDAPESFAPDAIRKPWAGSSIGRGMSIWSRRWCDPTRRVRVDRGWLPPAMGMSTSNAEICCLPSVAAIARAIPNRRSDSADVEAARGCPALPRVAPGCASEQDWPGIPDLCWDPGMMDGP